MAIAAGRACGNRHMIGRLYLTGKVIEIRAMAANAISRGRMCCILDLVGAARAARSCLETHVLRIGAIGCWIDRVLTHCHPGVTAFMATLTVRANARMNLRRRRRRSQEQRTWRQRDRVRRNHAVRHGG